MKRRCSLYFIVALYAHTTIAQAASPCDTFRSDIQAIQSQVRQVEVDRSANSTDVVSQASKAVKSGCLDPLASLDMTTLGFTPGAAALVTKMGSEACKQLAAQLSQRVSQATQIVGQGQVGVEGALSQFVGLNGSGNTPGFNPNVNAWGAGGTVPQQPQAPEQSVGSSISSGFARLRDLIIPRK